MYWWLLGGRGQRILARVSTIASEGSAQMKRHRGARRMGGQWDLSGLGRRALKGLVALVVAVASFVVTVPSASAAVQLTLSSTLGSAGLMVGYTNQPATLTIGWNNTPSEAGDSDELCDGAAPQTACASNNQTGITLVPFCLAGTAGFCPTADSDPGVITVNPTGAGAAGTACMGITFNIREIDTTEGI